MSSSSSTFAFFAQERDLSTRAMNGAIREGPLRLFMGADAAAPPLGWQGGQQQREVQQ